MALILLVSVDCFAGAGKDGFPFLTLGAGARQEAMGGSGVSLPGEVNGAYWNPAAWGAVRGKEMSLYYASQMDTARLGALSYAQGLERSTLGLQILTFDSGDIQGYDSSGGKTGTLAVKDSMVALGYGRPWGEDLTWGVNVKHVQETLPGASASANALDAGLLYQKGDWPIRFGAALRNEGTQATFENEKTSLPRSVDFGASYQALAQSLLATVEGHEPSDGARYWTGGVEWWVYNTLAFRAGYDSGTDAGNGLTMGIGVKMKDFRIDYAYTNQGDSFGGAQRVGVSYRFGGAGDRAYQQGLALMQKGDYAAAVLKFKEALDADPGNRAAMRALKEAAQKLRKERAAS